jgi:hypothetical protein
MPWLCNKWDMESHPPTIPSAPSLNASKHSSPMSAVCSWVTFCLFVGLYYKKKATPTL